VARSTSSKRSGGPSDPPRYGSKTPRVFTPPLRRLTRATTLGYEAIEFAEKILGIVLWPWQKWLLLHALELLEDGTFRFRRIVLLVGRQNGKSTVLQVLTLWRMYCDDCHLTIGTAQNLDVAEEVWESAIELAEGVEELADKIDQVTRVNGKKTLKLDTGERYKVAAASRRGGRGFAGAELVLLDELREHQSWDSWAAVTKTTQTKERAQIWGVSNAGDAASIVLRYLRKMAHDALGDPDGLTEVDDPDAEDLDDDLDDAHTIGIFEWSAQPGCAIGDRKGWAQANPSLGHMISERVLAGDAATDPEWVFRTEVLCQWSDGSVEGPFPPGTWEATTDKKSSIPEGNPLVFAVDFAWDRSTAHIAVAGHRSDGLTHVEIVASRAGTDWVIPWLTERKDTAGLVAVTWQANGAPVSSLTPVGDDGEEIEEVAGIRFLPWRALGPSCGAFYDQVSIVEEHPAQGLRHRPQPVLDVAAATAQTRPLTDAWVWDRKKSSTDIAPLVAVTAAKWALGVQPPRPKSPDFVSL
jgi:hypothetical protein